MAIKPATSATATASEIKPPASVAGFINSFTSPPLKTTMDFTTEDFYSDFILAFLKPQHIHRGRLTCLLSVKPPILNAYGGLHGGAVAAVAEKVAIACARTVVGKDKELFLGESSMSYLSSVQDNAEVVVDASVVRSGRNLTVIALEFRLKDSERLVYTSRATFYNMPVSSL